MPVPAARWGRVRLSRMICPSFRSGACYFLPFIMQRPMALHLAGLGHLEQGVNFGMGFLAIWGS